MRSRRSRVALPYAVYARECNAGRAALRMREPVRYTAPTMVRAISPIHEKNQMAAMVKTTGTHAERKDDSCSVMGITPSSIEDFYLMAASYHREKGFSRGYRRVFPGYIHRFA